LGGDTGLTPALEQWVEGVQLQSGKFSFEGHEYQRGILSESHQRQVFKKGSQLGLSECQILKSLHGMIAGKYNQGVLYLFPSERDMFDFSRARFAPLVRVNEQIAREVQNTDSISLKQVRSSNLYMRGARKTAEIGGQKKTATQLLSIPVDRVVFDERDHMDDEMVELALKRMGHSSVKEEVYCGTPSIPDYGVSKLYEESDKRVWEIKCEHCGSGTVLELEFPNCLVETSAGVIRTCKKCKRQIYSVNGRWVVSEPSKTPDLAGFWVSRLNSPFADLKAILDTFNSGNEQKKQELYNSELGLPYAPVENRLRQRDVYECCGQDPMVMAHPGPCCMGVDVGREFAVTIACKPKERQLQIVYIGRPTDFNELQSLANRFNVKCAVIDAEPELRKSREFVDSGAYGWLCDYQDSIMNGPAWNHKDRMIKAQRTETCDATHDLVHSGLLILPRRNGEIEEFARQCCNVAKILEEDGYTGSKVYRYKKLGDDHYRHSLNYCWMAAQKTPVYAPMTAERAIMEAFAGRMQVYDPLIYGLGIKTI
jgi:hypothetical protein